MRIPRIFVDQPLNIDQDLLITGSAANHIARVLRMGPGRPLKLFNGQPNASHQYGFVEAEVTQADKKTVTVRVKHSVMTQLESPLDIQLGQAISKGDRMDFTIQKAVELGVTQITPLWTEHCDVKLNAERLDKKMQHWQQIAISACEQSGRDRVPQILPAEKLSTWLASSQQDVRWVLDPRGQSAASVTTQPKSASILVGPEGGLSDAEVSLAAQHRYEAKLIGPRILRTETAALTAITLMQSMWGDF